jgi:hypothetical protein
LKTITGQKKLQNTRRETNFKKKKKNQIRGVLLTDQTATKSEEDPGREMPARKPQQQSEATGEEKEKKREQQPQQQYKAMYPNSPKGPSLGRYGISKFWNFFL